jgi:hypothetical protein
MNATKQIQKCALSKLKQHKLKCKLMNVVVRRQQERLEEIHALNVTSLKLDIAIKKATLAKLAGKYRKKTPSSPQPFEISFL